LKIEGNSFTPNREMLSEKERVTLVRDGLYINNELYIVPEENELNEMQEDAFEIDQGNLEDDFIPYRYINRADGRPQNDSGESHRHQRNTKGAVGRMTMTIHFPI
jgi:hypothetical protein